MRPQALQWLVTLATIASCALSAAATAQSLTQPTLLEPEQAFRFSARAIEPGRIEVRFDVAFGYYMYRNKLAFKTDTPGLRLRAPEMPKGEVKQDAIFGRVETYRRALVIRVPYQGHAQSIRLEVQSQGCADVGICYPLQTQRIELAL